ncbi:MAG TPA: hypothetical protein VM432_02125, partial [Bdellovibrionales bacterium]|nr:hypothetical protein [Bdellovibrionales bacterium]
LYAVLIKGDSETTLGFRLGHILVPFGVTNLQFEPPMYPGVNRPMFEETLFPKAWSENGVTGFILVGPVQGQLGTLYDDDFGFFARVDTAPAGNGTGFTKPGLGVSIYRGTVAEISEENVNLAELHGAIRFDRFQFAAILTGGLLTDEERIGGSTIVLMYDLFRESFENGAQLPIFVSFEDEKIREIKNDLWTFGLNFKPDQQVVIKTDIAIESGRGRDTDTRFEAGMGLAF